MAEEKKRAVILTDPRIQRAEYWRNELVANAPEGATVTDVLKPEFWSHVADKLRPYDRIEVRVDTGEWLLELLVLDVGRAWARVVVLHKYDLEPVEVGLPAAQTHEVKWKGPQLKWCVIRLSDSEVIFKELEKAEAVAQMERHERAVA